VWFVIGYGVMAGITWVAVAILFIRSEWELGTIDAGAITLGFFLGLIAAAVWPIVACVGIVWLISHLALAIARRH
jgi:hypothetical protein